MEFLSLPSVHLDLFEIQVGSHLGCPPVLTTAVLEGGSGASAAVKDHNKAPNTETQSFELLFCEKPNGSKEGNGTALLPWDCSPLGFSLLSLSQ